MIKLLADASLPALDTCFKAFRIDTYPNENALRAKLAENEILICRSTLDVNAALLHNTSIKLIATASSGISHFDLQWLERNRIRYFSARGANAHAVADYVCTVLAFLKKKQNFSGKKAGVIGYGAVGRQVTKRLSSLGFKIQVFDPLIPSIEIEEAFRCDFQDLYDSDILCIHCNYHPDAPHPSHHLIDADFLKAFNPEGIILNAARGNIVDESALLASENINNYCTDVFAHEPHINQSVVNHCRLATPHIAGHTIEAKRNAVALIARQIHNACNLPFKMPDFTHDAAISIDPSDPNWPDQILQHYDPQIDFKKLKTSPSIPDDFEKFRAAHNFRHDIGWKQA